MSSPRYKNGLSFAQEIMAGILREDEENRLLLRNKRFSSFNQLILIESSILDVKDILIKFDFCFVQLLSRKFKFWNL